MQNFLVLKKSPSYFESGNSKNLTKGLLVKKFLKILVREEF